MIVDSSALVAILQNEPEALRLSQSMALDPVCSVSAANWLEASMIMFVRFGSEGIRDLDLLGAKASLEIAAVTPRQADIARRAFMKYGKGIHTYPLHEPRAADLNGRGPDWDHDERKGDDGLRAARMVPVPPAG